MENLTPGIGLKIQSVSFGYSPEELILNSISLDIQPGEFISILGPSGCGKSTLLRLIAELETPMAGTIHFETRQLPLVRGVVFQEPRLLPWRTVLENVRLPLDLAHADEASTNRSRAMEAIEKVGLADAYEKRPDQLSGGMKMRVSVARALVSRPSLLLLDEPFSALDETTRYSLQEDLRALWRKLGMTIIFVTHSVSEAVFLSNRAIILGKSPSQILNQHQIQLPADRDSSIRLDKAFSDEVKKYKI